MDRTSNLLGAFALAIADGQLSALAKAGGLSASAAAAINSIAQYPDMVISSLAEIIGLSHSATVRLADDLERQGLIRRLRGGKDGRTVTLTATKEGHALAKRMRKARLAFLERALNSIDPSLRGDFEQSITEILVALTTDRRAADHICRHCDEVVCDGAACPVEQCARSMEIR